MNISLRESQLNSAIAQQVQHRHILNMMGIECWVGRETVAVSMTDINTLHAPTENSPVQSVTSSPNIAPSQTLLIDKSAPQDSELSAHQHEQSDTNFETEHINDVSLLQPVTSEQSLSIQSPSIQSPSIQGQPKKLISSSHTPVDPMSIEQHIEPFTLLGVGFGEWVLLVDGKQLYDGASQQLWHNIVTSMSLTEQSLSFPICENMQSVSLANASLAGFVFRIAQDDTKSVAALTPLPEALDHERLVSVPQLTDMLADGRQKRQLWQLLTKSSLKDRNDLA